MPQTPANKNNEMAKASYSDIEKMEHRPALPAELLTRPSQAPQADSRATRPSERIMRAIMAVR